MCQGISGRGAYSIRRRRLIWLLKVRYFRQDIEGGGRRGWQGVSWGASGGKEGQREFLLELRDKVFSSYGLTKKPTEIAKTEKQSFLGWFLERKRSSRTIKSGSKRHSRYVHCESCILSFWMLFCWMFLGRLCTFATDSPFVSLI